MKLLDFRKKNYQYSNGDQNHNIKDKNIESFSIFAHFEKKGLWQWEFQILRRGKHKSRAKSSKSVIFLGKLGTVVSNLTGGIKPFLYKFLTQITIPFF